MDPLHIAVTRMSSNFPKVLKQAIKTTVYECGKRLILRFQKTTRKESEFGLWFGMNFSPFFYVYFMVVFVF